MINLRGRTIGIAVSIAALAGLWVAAPSQAAFTTPEYQSTFTGSGDHQIGNTRAVAVDQTTHDIYVADRTNHRIEKFDGLGNFLFMFGDGVNQTTGGNICPVSPGDVCRAGQMSSPTFPHWNSPSAVAVDNSNGLSKGDVYVADASEGQITKFDSGGHQITSNFGTNGVLQVYPFKMTVSAFTGYVWIIDQNWQIVSYDENGTEGVRVNQNWNVGGEDDLAVDAVNDIYYGSTGGVPLKANVKQESEFGGEDGVTDPGQARGYYINPANGDVLISFGEEVVVHDKTCNPALGYCAVKDSFGTGHLSDSRGLAVDSASGSVYVADSNGIEYFKPKVIPDITPTGQPAAGHTDATLFAHVDPLGAGNITECKVEWGPTKNYGNSVPCDQSLPIASAEDITAKLSGLTAESTYHYRFTVANGNGTTKTADLLATPHWVKNLITGEADVNGPGEVTLHGSLDPNGEENHYFFEWGTTNAYGHKIPDATGIDPGTTPGDTPVSMSLDGLVTSETTYHYRIVGYTPLGTSKGVDKTFTTPIAEMPEVRGYVGLERRTGNRDDQRRSQSRLRRHQLHGPVRAERGIRQADRDQPAGRRRRRLPPGHGTARRTAARHHLPLPPRLAQLPGHDPGAGRHLHDRREPSDRIGVGIRPRAAFRTAGDPGGLEWLQWPPDRPLRIRARRRLRLEHLGERAPRASPAAR